SATTVSSTLSLRDALPICDVQVGGRTVGMVTFQTLEVAVGQVRLVHLQQRPGVERPCVHDRGAAVVDGTLVSGTGTYELLGDLPLLTGTDEQFGPTDLARGIDPIRQVL